MRIKDLIIMEKHVDQEPNSLEENYETMYENIKRNLDVIIF